jgi:alpha-tubulin suppressor-like RCC1 family protein
MPMRMVESRLAAVMLLGIAIGSCKKDASGPGDEQPINPPFYTDPTLVSTQLAFVQLGAGFHHACGVTGDGAAWCWGWNENASLGTTEPMACGLATDGRAYCWGFNPYGQVGRPGSEVDP